jgi:hypothetical protein
MYFCQNVQIQGNPPAWASACFYWQKARSLILERQGQDIRMDSEDRSRLGEDRCQSIIFLTLPLMLYWITKCLATLMPSFELAKLLWKKKTAKCHSSFLLVDIFLGCERNSVEKWQAANDCFLREFVKIWEMCRHIGWKGLNLNSVRTPCLQKNFANLKTFGVKRLRT